MTDSNNTEREIDATSDTPVTFQVRRSAVPVSQQLLLLGALLLLIFGSAYTPKLIERLKGTGDTIPASVPYTDTAEARTNNDGEKPATPFSDIAITARSAYVWDVTNQRALYKKNESTELVLASITKLMTALVAHELLSEKTAVPIISNAINQEGDSGLLEGETFERLSLSDLVLMSSSNDGAYALAAAGGSLLGDPDGARSFVDAMNVRAEELGLTQTHFKNPTGLDISKTQGGAYGSARDMAFLMEYIVLNQPSILEYTQAEETRVYNTDGISHDAENTNYYLDEIPGLIGSKTGYTDLAGGNLVVAFDAGLNNPIIISVLGSTRQDRFTDVVTLIRESQEYMLNQ